LTSLFLLELLSAYSIVLLMKIYKPNNGNIYTFTNS